jgi:hypothetical protein
MSFSLFGTFIVPSKKRKEREQTTIILTNPGIRNQGNSEDDAGRKVHSDEKNHIFMDNSDCDAGGSDITKRVVLPCLTSDSKSSNFWSAWNMGTHIRRLVEQRPETACIDGLKVGSILWIIAAHVMAIQSSTGV